jgi:hypothetical protein
VADEPGEDRPLAVLSWLSSAPTPDGMLDGVRPSGFTGPLPGPADKGEPAGEVVWPSGEDVLPSVLDGEFSPPEPTPGIDEEDVPVPSAPLAVLPALLESWAKAGAVIIMDAASAVAKIFMSVLH